VDRCAKNGPGGYKKTVRHPTLSYGVNDSHAKKKKPPTCQQRGGREKVTTRGPRVDMFRQNDRNQALYKRDVKKTKDKNSTKERRQLTKGLLYRRLCYRFENTERRRGGKHGNLTGAGVVDREPCIQRRDELRSRVVRRRVDKDKKGKKKRRQKREKKKGAGET